MWTVLLSTLAPPVEAKPAVIYGNAHGLWSPTHPHLTNGNVQPKTNSPVRYVPPPPPEPELLEHIQWTEAVQHLDVMLSSETRAVRLRAA